MSFPRVAVLMISLTASFAAGRGQAQLTEIENMKWHQGLLGGMPMEGEFFGASVSAGDFNGDGVHDLAIGSPLEQVDGQVGAGQVDVLLGGMDGLSAGAQIWHQNIDGVDGAAEEGDGFGSALAAGDFNNDGYDDLAVSVRREDIEATADAGAVNILYGSPGGLTVEDDQIWFQNSAGMLDSSEEGDGFGYSLAVGDFNNDTFDDLAVGVPFEGIAGATQAGAVQVLFGGESGLTATGNQFWNQDILERSPEEGDRFGFSLSAGDFNGDGFSDLAIGVFAENLGEVASAGAVQVLMGGGEGLTFLGNQVWDKRLLDDTPEQFDQFGAALAVGDFNADGFDDLAAGAPTDRVDGVGLAGSVHLVLGSASGLTAAGNQLWHQGLLGEALEAGDIFGLPLTAGDFNNDGFADLVAGVMDEDLNGLPDVGAAHVLFGDMDGLSAEGSQVWSEFSLVGTPESGDQFSGDGNFTVLSNSLSAGDFNADGSDDLAVGVPNDNDPGASDAGAVHVIHGMAGATTIPQISNGPDFWTLFQVFDVAGGGGAYKVEFFDSAGDPLTLPFTNEAGEMGDSLDGLEGMLPSNGVATFRTYPSGELRTPGYAVLREGAGRVAVNSVLTQEIPGRPPFQAGIPLMPALQRSIIPLSNARPLTTTLAWVNRAAGPQEVTTIFLDEDGTEGCQATSTLASNQHQPFVISNRLPCSAGRNGSVEILGGEQGVAPIAFFFQDFGPFVSNIPRNLDRPPVGDIIPQVTSGGNFSAEGEFISQFQIVNLKDETVFYGISFLDDFGDPLDIPMADDDGNFDRATDRVAGSIPARGSVILGTFPMPQRRAGYGLLDVGAGDVIINTTLTQRVEGRPPFQASMPLRRPIRIARFPYLNTRPFTTTYAHANPLNDSQEITFSAVNEEGVVGCSSTSMIGAQGHEAFVVAQRLPCTANSVGQVIVESEGGLGSVALLFQDFGPFTSNLPVPQR